MAFTWFGTHRKPAAKGLSAPFAAMTAAGALALCALLAGCAGTPGAATGTAASGPSAPALQASDIADASSSSASGSGAPSAASSSAAAEPGAKASSAASASGPSTDELLAQLNLEQDFRASFDHGPKPAEYQRYIVLHDTEGEGSASGVVDYWDGNGAGVAAHFVINKDGSIVQCVPMDRITHHAGYGDAGHNDLYGIVEDGRDDMVGSVPIGDWAPDYGMNAWSIGIEMVHVGGSGYYPEEQLAALDALIAYIDSYFGDQSTIIDHKAWRSGNSDTSPEFAEYLANYQDHRTHG